MLQKHCCSSRGSLRPWPLLFVAPMPILWRLRFISSHYSQTKTTTSPVLSWGHECIKMTLPRMIQFGLRRILQFGVRSDNLKNQNTLNVNPHPVTLNWRRSIGGIRWPSRHCSCHSLQPNPWLWWWWWWWWGEGNDGNNDGGGDGWSMSIKMSIKKDTVPIFSSDDFTEN